MSVAEIHRRTLGLLLELLSDDDQDDVAVSDMETAFADLVNVCQRSGWIASVDVFSPTADLRSSMVLLSRSLLHRVMRNEADPNSRPLGEVCHQVIRRLTKQVRRRESIEAISQRQFYNFAYGLTHEINNPLANISARAQQLLRKTTDATDLKSLATIVDQSDRAYDMLAEVMRIVQPTQLVKRQRPVADWIEPITCQLQSICTEKNILLQIDCDEGLQSRFDSVQMAAAVWCCLLNAVEACRRGDEIRVQIGPVRSGRWKISISDSGRGLSPKAMQSAFDIYFSGRESGRGLGLGLAKARRIIEAHGGTIDLDSIEQAATNVTLTLPV
jgi:signal transduction histidine kinase